MEWNFADTQVLVSLREIPVRTVLESPFGGSERPICESLKGKAKLQWRLMSQLMSLARKDSGKSTQNKGLGCCK